MDRRDCDRVAFYGVLSSSHFVLAAWSTTAGLLSPSETTSSAGLLLGPGTAGFADLRAAAPQAGTCAATW